MPALIIIASLVLAVIFLLSVSVSAELTYENESVEYIIKYLFFTIAAQPESERRKRKREKKKAKEKKREQKILLKQKKPKKQKEPMLSEKNDIPQAGKPKAQPVSEANKAKTEKPKKQKQKFDFDFEMIKRIISAASPHIKRIFRKIRIYDVYFDIVVGGDDAARTAINYGKMNMVINGLLCFLDSIVSLKVGEVNIEADFDKEKTDFFAHSAIKLRLSTLLHSVIWGYFAVMKEMNKNEAVNRVKYEKNRKAA